MILDHLETLQKSKERADFVEMFQKKKRRLSSSPEITPEMKEARDDMRKSSLESKESPTATEKALCSDRVYLK